jgi:hypothetical protein
LYIFICGCEYLAPVQYPECGSSSYPYWTEWSDGQLISIVDDSLAILMTEKSKKECSYNDKEKVVSYRSGLFLVNYRIKQKPLLGDTLELEYESLLSYFNGLKVVNGYFFRDTSVLVFDVNGHKFGFWKIGEKSIKLNNQNILTNDPLDLGSAKNAAHWVNGNIIFQTIYFTYILDTEKRQIERFEPSNEYEWMSSGYEWMAGDELIRDIRCRDSFLSYINGKVICAMPRLSAGCYESKLFVDGVVTDTIDFLAKAMLGNYIFASQNGRVKILKIDTENFKFDETFELWVDDDSYPTKFYKDKEKSDFASYSGKDLIGGR